MRTLIFIFGCITLTFNGMAQNSRTVFVGFQPGITKEKFYADNEFDLNVFPLVLETALTHRINIRSTFVANYHFGNNSQFSDLGLQIIAPFYLKKKADEIRFQYGVYIGPVAGMGRNLLNKHFTNTLGVEGGYMFKADKRFTLTVGMQFGGSYFNYDNLTDKWVEHFGIKVNLGWLFNI